MKAQVMALLESNSTTAINGTLFAWFLQWIHTKRVYWYTIVGSVWSLDVDLDKLIWIWLEISSDPGQLWQ